MTPNASQADQKAAGYSSEVRLFLIVEDRTYPLAQIGPDFVILREQADLPLVDAEILMTVDDYEQRWLVTLENRTARSELEFAISDR